MGGDPTTPGASFAARDFGAERRRVQRSKPRRELGRLDAVCLLIAAIVVPDTLGAVARGGAQTVTWLAIVAVLFFVPAGLVIAELGTAFPLQGGPYVWARLAFGRYAGALVALIYSVETPIWVGGSLAITAVAVIDQLVVPLHGGWRVLVALGFVWTTVTLAVVPLRVGKRVPLAGAAAQVALLAFFTATVVVYAAREGVGGLTADDLTPPGRCSPSSRRCWSTSSSASSCRRRPPRSCATRSGTSPPRSRGQAR